MAVGMTQQDIETGGARLLGALREVECALRALGIGRGNGQRVTIVVPSDDDLTQAGIAATMGWKAACGETWRASHGQPFSFYEVGVTSAPRYEAEAVDRYKKNYELVRQAVEDMPVYLHPFPDGAMRWRKPVVREAGYVTMTDYQHRMAWRGKAVASGIVKGR